jgi:hypothetical protein
MKKIDLYFDNPPSSIKEKLFVDKLKDLLEKKKKGENVEIEGYAPSDVKKELIKIFNNKCAFCESDISTGHHYDTEHFRPKNKYYWLAYEWSNFLLACRKCNSDCKGEQFPIEGVEVEHAILHFETEDRLYKDISHIHIKLIRAINGEDMRGNKLPKSLPFSSVRKACLTNFKTFFIDDNALFTLSQKEILNKVYGTLLKNIKE